MMAYGIFWKPRALGDLKALDRGMQARIIEKLEYTADSPSRFLDWIKKFGVYKLRVGDYRVFVDLNQADETIEVLTIQHRSRAYERL